MLNQEEIDQIQQTSEWLLHKMDLQLKTRVFAKDDEVEINISGPDHAYLTMDGGETITALQYILSRMIRQQIPSAAGHRIFLDTDGFMFRHHHELRKLAARTMEKVRNERRAISLPPMNPYDRKIVHTEIARTQSCESVSEGDGFFKRIRILPKD
ncbi:MAG TPA: R3H domain-containing nucleic acid-binding protein [Acidobacteriota bacterium]|nr:R3H domain-containing nucleic acid-binding protein [Acidobacteriota bacterium]